MEHKRLYRSTTNKVFAGICGGLAEYFDIDATIIRLFWMLVVIFTGIFPGVVAYVLAVIIVPLPPEARVHEQQKTETGQHHP